MSTTRPVPPEIEKKARIFAATVLGGEYNTFDLMQQVPTPLSWVIDGDNRLALAERLVEMADEDDDLRSALIATGLFDDMIPSNPSQQQVKHAVDVLRAAGVDLRAFLADPLDCLSEHASNSVMAGIEINTWKIDTFDRISWALQDALKKGES